jgi:hypothetical protein
MATATAGTGTGTHGKREKRRTPGGRPTSAHIPNNKPISCGERTAIKTTVRYVLRMVL